ncbi:JM60 [macacine gammaherpesvirus 11]|uniref:JM60 n=2 Tax=macacine gammaherpesvirus 11 TaxID=2560570 RepID=G9JM68_9GAMA|nr:JM60 [Macaca fuscata rhadinovirus]AAT00037.1 JM60 [Macaca fuscata rhadinovirus]AEW87585.1 JM60 [Macaca fuscata rhadinovirus]AEW87755.1 JM60 [Macaca fuscata rhadinovirus]
MLSGPNGRRQGPAHGIPIGPTDPRSFPRVSCLCRTAAIFSQPVVIFKWELRARGLLPRALSATVNHAHVLFYRVYQSTRKDTPVICHV